MSWLELIKDEVATAARLADFLRGWIAEQCAGRGVSIELPAGPDLTDLSDPDLWKVRGGNGDWPARFAAAGEKMIEPCEPSVWVETIVLPLWREMALKEAAAKEILRRTELGRWPPAKNPERGTH